MTTPTPRTDALTKKLHTGKSALQVANENWEKPYRELCELLERDLAAAQEARQRAEDQVERLLLDSEGAHAAITALNDDRARLQQALYFWLPSIACEDSSAGERAAKDARLLVSLDLKDEPSAYELGWIVMDSEAKLLRDERNRAEERAERNARALDNIERGLRKAGATLPAPEITGTIEGSMNTGLCIALCLVVTEREAIDAAIAAGEGEMKRVKAWAVVDDKGRIESSNTELIMRLFRDADYAKAFVMLGERVVPAVIEIQEEK